MRSSSSNTATAMANAYLTRRAATPPSQPVTSPCPAFTTVGLTLSNFSFRLSGFKVLVAPTMPTEPPVLRSRSSSFSSDDDEKEAEKEPEAARAMEEGLPTPRQGHRGRRQVSQVTHMPHRL